MAAGQGFKTFANGEVLSAADVNGYLMQGVLVFADATARDAAITSPSEGQFAYTKDNNSLWYYTGSAWAASGATGDIEGVTAGVGISGGGTSGTVTITNSMATAIDAKGDLVAGTGADAFSRLAVGTDGQILTADSTASTGVKWATPSSGATTWTSRQNAIGSGAVNQIAYNGSNLYIAIGNFGRLFTSPDGITWTSRTSGFGSNHIYAVAYGNGTWVIGGQNGTMATSTDGITWTSRTSGFGTNQIRSIVYGNSLWVAVGGNARITTSTNATTWTERGTSGASTIMQVIYENSRFVAVGYTDTNNIFTSTDGTTWTSLVTSGGENLNFVFYYSGKFIALGIPSSTGVAYYSTNGTTWTSFSTVAQSYVLGAAAGGVYNGNLYLLTYQDIGYTVNPQIKVVTASVDTTVGQFNSYGTPISLPQGFYNGNTSCIYIGTDGKMIVADYYCRIWTSF